jgi:nickel/cobalt exporter
MRVITALLLSIILWVGFMPQSYAQTVEGESKTVVIDKRKLLVQPKNSDGTVIATPFLESPVRWMQEKQTGFYKKIATSMAQLRSTSSTAAAWTILSLSFLYGVFHAAGPGHGKAVVTGWLLATENELKRGLALAFLSALFQSLTAIIIVSALVLFVSGASAMARDVADVLESVSYLMIAGMGLFLIWRTFRSTAQVQTKTLAGPFELVSRPSSGVDHVHDEHCGCGHAHAPAAADVKGEWTWKRLVTMAFAVGLRPCSGAILVLIGSYTIGLYTAGVVAVLAMGLGVFITVAAIATSAVFAKSLALRLTSADNPWTSFIARWGRVAIGLCITGFGLLLFMGSLGTSLVM